MATRKTYKFLPTVFQSDANKKFLSATMDQLTTDPNLNTLYGYVGRKFAPTYKSGDSYITEPDVARQHYQLEPGVVIRNINNNITFVADYVDLLDKIDYYGGITTDHSRLFEQEYYTFDPKISYDKLVNFSQYYWLPNGPDPVEVSSTGVDITATYTVTRDGANGRYIFKNNGVVDNSIIFAHGGVYEFVVDQPGFPFWIQTELGVDGVVSATPTLSSRDIYGVDNNGTDQGTITFRVPQTYAQDRWVNMPTVFSADYATPIPYSKLANRTLSQFLAEFPQYAGITGQLNGKYTIFVDVNTWDNAGEAAWTNPSVIDSDGDVVPGYAAGDVIAEADRYDVWRVIYVDIGQKLKLDAPVAANITAGTSLTVGTQLTSLLYDAVAGQEYVYVPNTFTTTVGEQVKRTDVVTSLSATASGTNYITVTSTAGLVANMPVVFVGAPEVGGIVSGTTYYVKEVVNLTTLTISETVGGSEFALSNDTGIMDVTASYTDIPAGTLITSIVKGDPLLKLVHTQDVAVNEKVYIRFGVLNANKEYYKDYDGFFYETPIITAQNEQLWIQDGVAAGIYAPIKIIDYAGWDIDVVNDIIGQQNYTSPNGVEFTSGLKIQFGDDVIPASYQNRQFYVEQVGDLDDGIQLIPVDELVTPELYNDEISINYPGEYFPDYITVNRANKSRNAWARNNRWFHIDVITASATYNNTVPVFDNGVRGQRPIVQFEANYQLFNDGRIAKAPIDILDTSITNAFTQLQGQTFTNIFGIEIIDSNGNVVYPDGLRVIFAADEDPLVKNKIYVLTVVQYEVDDIGNPTGTKYIELTKASDGDVEAYNTTVVKLGLYKGSQWWFDGINWNSSQQKEYLQQAPLFDVLDSTGKSLGNYTRSSFAGTQLFGYVRATSGTADQVLSRGPVAPIYDSDNNLVTNFYLSYKNFTTQGDIKFQNFFSTDTFSYVGDNGSIVTKDISEGYLQKVIDTQNLKPKNTWLTVPEHSKQYQLFNFVFDGSNNPFTIDITPNTNERSIPYLKVFLNYSYLSASTEWSINNNVVTVLAPLTINDRIDILVYSSEISESAYYQVPQNLDLNAQNININTLTLGQLRNHLIAMAENSTVLEGDVIAASNLRDIDIKQQGGTILKHSAPVPYSSLFLIDQQANFVDGIRFAQQEYSKFKNKFLELAISLPGIDPTDAITSVDTILNKINLVKNKSFPWYYSDMVPYGPLKNIVGQIGNIDGFEVFDPLKLNYEITNIFNDQQLSNQAVLVYLNDNQLIKGVDYVFRTDTPSIDFNVTLAVGDIIKIVEYSNTDGNYIPETPSKLGLWPSYIPEIFVDDTYRTPTTVIRGHDGSITPIFGDYRDDFLLELEKRIYNNIKLPANTSFGDIFTVIPGKFRSGDYTLAEINQVLSSSFMTWIGNNSLDYTLNDTFEANDPFTWNYGKSHDRIDGELLPGSWRACYMYFYDTFRPHITPWEMLGFTSKPSWWESYYGAAPYTGANKFMWDDLEAGYIRSGDRQGIDLNYARPGLSQIIPIDENGNLISVASLLCQSFNSRNSGAAWSAGQQGPVEFAWRMTSEFPYAVQQALALTKPAKYFGTLIDVYNYTPINTLYSTSADMQGVVTANEQYLMSSTNKQITQGAINYNGNTSSGTVNRSAGYLNWIVDYLINQGVNPNTYLIPMLTNYQVNLTYKVGGFTDQRYLQVLAEQVSPTSTNDSILVPAENYNVYLNEKPVPVDELTYSAVIIEKTTNGYSVRGYDLTKSYFTIIPSIVNNNASKITVLNRSATVYNDYQNLLMTVPYGYEFTSVQQISDFLISYERYLKAQGWTFTDTDPQLEQLKDWKLSVREFLYWSQQGWKPGSILVVSPVSSTLNAVTSGAVTAGIEDAKYSSKVVDQNFNLIKNNKYSVYRTPTEFRLNLQDAASVIGYVEVDLVRYEHTLVFDNVTVFNDVIYQPESGNRQFRLKLIGQRTANWNGSLSPEGFIYNSGVVDIWDQGKDYLKGDLVTYKEQYYTALQDIPANPSFQFQYWQVLPKSEIQKGLLPNFSTIAVQSQGYYDSYAKIRDNEQLAYSHALIGFRERQYLADLGLTETSQIEFYKGYIAQKGSKNAVDAFTKATINNLTSNISLYEEWAVRVGEYGALTSNPFIEIPLDEKAFGVNPSIARFVDQADNNIADGISVFNSSQLYKSYGTYSANVALYRTENSNTENDIPTAGYVNIDDVDAQIFDLTNYVDLDGKINDMGSGYLIWVAKDFTQNWNVYRVTETNNHVTAVTNSLNGYIAFTTENPHGFSKYDVFLVKDFDAQFDGFYQVLQVTSASHVLVKYHGVITDIANLTTQAGNGVLFRMDSMRFKYMEDSRIYGLNNPPNGWRVGDKIWIDDDAETTAVQGQPFGTQPNGTWKVYEKDHPWSVGQEVQKGISEYNAADQFGTSVRMSADGLSVVVGAPGTNGNVGQVSTFLKDYEGNLVEGFSLVPLSSNTYAFGHSIDLATDENKTLKLAVGAPDSWSGNGYVYVYDKNINSQTFERSQIIAGNAVGKFGYSLAFNRTGEWLYVGAPDTNTVYAYGLNRFVTTQSQITSINNKYTLYLSSNIGTINAGDTVIQANTGARATVLGVTSYTELVVDTLTNFVIASSGSDGNVAVGNLTILANLSVLSSGNLAAKTVYPFNFASNAVTNTVNLTFTPDPTVGSDANSLMVMSSDKMYIPNIDYVFEYNNNRIRFINNGNTSSNANISATTLTVSQRPYYSLIEELPIPTGNSWAQYGFAVSSSFDGAQLAVGAPGDTVADINGILQPGAGSVYVFDRVIEAFNTVTDAVAGTGGRDYQTENDIAAVHKVTISGIEVTDYTIVGTNIIRFINPPAIGQVIFVEVNKFNLLERLIGVDSLEGGLAAIQANAAFGTSLTICSNNCAIYIGAPNYDNGTEYNSGAVWKFHNRGRLYGTDTGYVKNPTFTPINTIRLNNFEVRINLGLSDNLTVNAGDWITQPSTGANVQVLASSSGNYVKVSEYQNANVFTVGANVAVNSAWPTSNVAVRLTSLDEFVQDVNNADILGVTATNENGYLRLDSDVTVAKDQLRILSGTLNNGLGPLAESEMIVFAFMQIIVNPFGLPGEYFGNKVKLASNAYMLVIGSARGTTKDFTTFDITTTENGTVLDNDSTRFHDSILGSGSVYIYELYDDPRDAVENPGRYAFAQQLNPGDLVTGGEFGYALDIESNFITVSALGATVPGAPEGSGTVYVFNNPTGGRGWKLIRYQQDRVDLDSVTRAYLYDNQSNLIKNNLQFIDPVKGRILGQAEQEISFKTEYDPAIYNQGFNPKADINQNVFWGENQVGKVWWNLSKVRYIDYEQDTLVYRSLHWGDLFEGSAIEVSEWVVSSVLPSQYVDFGGNGVPLYPDDSAYVEEIYVDPTTNIITNNYYYWVTNKTTVDPNNPARRMPTTAIADFIANPKNQGLPYTAIIRGDAIAFYNVADYLSADNTIVHLDHQLAINTDIIHSEYELIQKGNPNNLIPTKLVNKLIDSLAGIDAIGSTVPDPALSTADRYGIDTRPRQSMFINRLQAVSELVQYVNSIFAINPIAEQFNLSGLNDQEAEPNFKLGEYDQSVETDAELAYIDTMPLAPGYLVLVKSDSTQNSLWVLYELTASKNWTINRVQSYKTSLYWNYTDWYANGYSSATKPDFSVETTVDALKLAATQGTVIFIRNATGNNTWQLVEVDVDNTLSVVGIQNGTIQLDTSLSDYAGNELGFGNQDFDSNRYDQNPNNEIRSVVSALYNDIFVNTLQGEFNNLFFVLVNFILTEQNYVDWLFKSSFISVTHKLRTLSQFPSYVRDNQTYYQNYIEEVKPYRTKIREYLVDYTGEDTFGGDITDFDLPAYFDTYTGYGIFRSPSGEAPYADADSSTWQTWPYNQWYNNRTLQVFRIQIENAGANYAVPPTVTITSSNGQGAGATAVAIIDGNTGAISNIAVTNSGTGYTSTPIVTINGSSTESATAYPVMYNPMVRTFDSKLKFDRVKYTSNVKVWSANTTYYKTEFDSNGSVISGDIVTYAIPDGNVMIRKAYFINSNITTTTQFISSDYTVCPSSYFNNANDRIIGYYEPANTMPAVDTIRTAITVANTATNTNTIYVYNAASLAKNMYISESNVAAGYVMGIIGNVNLQVTSLGYFTGNLANGSSAIEGISNMSGLQVGQYVTGLGIPFDATIVSINLTTNSVNLTDSITGDLTSANIAFGGVPIKVTQVTLSTNVTLSTDTTIYARYDSLEQLVPGVTYPTSVTQGASFKLSPLFGRSYDIAAFDPVQYSKDGIALLSTSTYDQALYSLYANIALGTAPEDVVTQGGAFVDTYHSRAPEELVPGITFDTLDMRIYTQINNGANIVAYRYFDNMIDEPDYLRINGANIAKLEQPLNITDSNIYVTDASVLYTPNPLYLRPGVVFINGERITYYKKTIYTPVAWSANTSYTTGTAISNDGTNYIVTGNVNANSWSYVNSANVSVLVGLNVLSQLRRGTQGTGAPTVQPYWSDVVDASQDQRIPGTSYGNLIANVNVFYTPGIGVATDGTGLNGSTTAGALFLKNGVLGSNVIPSMSNELVTEDAINTITTEGNVAIYTEN